MLSFLNNTYGYNPGRYQGYSLDTPSYKFLARIDWNINENNKLNIRFSKSHDKDSSNPSSSTTPFKDTVIYPGGNLMALPSPEVSLSRVVQLILVCI